MIRKRILTQRLNELKNRVMLKAYYLDKNSNKVYGVKVSTLELSRVADKESWEIRRIEFESVDGSIRCVNTHENRYDVTNILDFNRYCYLYRDKECTQLFAEFVMDGWGDTNLILGKYGHRQSWYDKYNDLLIGFDKCLQRFVDENKYLVKPLKMRISKMALWIKLGEIDSYII